MDLDIGCGEWKHKGAIGRDIGKGKNDIIADAHFLPFIAHSFDTIFMIEVLEHLHSPFVALKEVKRVVKLNGHLHLSIPNMKFYRRLLRYILGMSVDQSYEHIYGWGVSELRNLLRHVGFKLVQIKYDNIERYHKKSIMWRILKHITNHHMLAYAQPKRIMVEVMNES